MSQAQHNVVPHTALPAAVRRFLAEFRDDGARPAPAERAPSAKATARGELAAFVLSLRATAGSLSAAADLARSMLAAKVAPPAIRSAMRCCARDVLPSRASLISWAQRYEAQGAAGVRGQHRGSRRTWYDWMPRALHFWLQPTRPHMGTVAFWLREEGHASATYHRVRTFLQALPETLGDEAVARVGKHYHEQNIRPCRVLDYTRVAPGMVYEGDGHTCDFYVQHPITGKHFRPELTIWIDWATNYVAGFFLWDRESGLNTLFALSRALVAHDHVPAAIHVDPGSGFKNRMMCDESVGYFARLGIHPIFARAGNARGKGLVEGWFHHFEDRCGKRFSSYCGTDRMDDALSRLEQRVAKGKLAIPSWDLAVDTVRAYVEAYNREPQRALGMAPADGWAGLERNPLHLTPDLILRPRLKATVRHWRVTFRKRVYQDRTLAQHEGRKVAIEYDLFDLSSMRVLTLEGRFICTARRVDAQPALNDSLIDDLNSERLAGQIRRHQRAVDELAAQAGVRLPDLRRPAISDSFYQEMEAREAAVIEATWSEPLFDLDDYEEAPEAAPTASGGNAFRADAAEWRFEPDA